MLQKVDLPRFFAGPVIVWIELRSKCGLQPLRKRTAAVSGCIEHLRAAVF